MKEKSALNKVFRRLRTFEDLVHVECGFEENIARTVQARAKLVDAIWEAVGEANQKGLDGFKVRARK